MIRLGLALAAVVALLSCRTTSGVGDSRSYRDFTPIAHPALVASPPCPDAAAMLEAFHTGNLKGPIATVAKRANEVLAKCPSAWEAHEVAGLVARVMAHDDEASIHFMHAAADLRATDTRFFLAEMDDTTPPAHVERAEVAFLDDVARNHPDPAVRADALIRRISTETRYGNANFTDVDAAGVIRSWQIIGAFDNDQGKGFLTAYPPEDAVKLDETMKGRLVDVHWRKIDHTWRNGAISLEDIMSPEHESVAYLATWLRSSAPAHAALVLSTTAPFRVFVNGRLVGEEQKVDRWTTDQFSIPIDLAAGGNQVLVKSAVEGGSWLFRARVVDAATGAPLIASSAVPANPAVAVVADGPLQFAKDTRAAAPHVDVVPLSNAGGARGTLILARSQARAGLVREALETARRYSEQSKETPLAVLVVSDLLQRNQEAGKSIDLLDRSIGDDTANAPAALLLARARFYEGKKRWDNALDDVKAIRTRDADVRSALALEAAIYDQRRWPIDRCRTLDDAIAAWPDVAWLWREKADCLGDRGYRSESRAAWRHALELEPGYATAMRRLADIAQSAGDLDEARHWLEQAAAVETTQPGVLLALENVARVNHDDKAARAYLAAARAIDPDGETSYAREGDIDYDAGAKDKALVAWKSALERNPDDSELAWHIDYVADEGLGALAKYAPTHRDIEAAIEAAIKKPAAPGSNAITILDSEVTSVNADGSSRSVVTEVALAVNQRGRDQLITFDVPRDSRILDAHSITPMGESQEASSITSGTIRFRKLDIGSITVVQYLEHRRAGGFLPNHYVSAFWFSQVQHDVRSSSWVLLLPKDRKIVSHLTQPIGGDVVKASVSDAGDKRVYTWKAENVPPLIPEPNMPAATNFLARVSVSTLDTWDEYARWEQALLKDAFRSNPEVDALATKLLDGATTKHEKIDRLFKYVSKDIRYTQEYESTIAGVKPHACPVVLERGYGDCKDKAVLLILLLQKAGVDADFAILRTTDAGVVEKDVPNQQFNHAIVYVKKQDGIADGFFTDPTTDALDLGNLRSDDQGAVSLVLEPESGAYRFVDIPYQQSELEYSRANVSLDVAKAKGHIDVSSRGAGASSQRRAVRDAETAKKLEQGWTSLLWPGATMTTGSADTSEDLLKPFTLAVDVDASAAIHDDSDGTRIDVPHISPFADLTKLAERKLPLRLGVPSTEGVDTTIAIPPGKKVVRAPADYHVTSGCFSAERTTTTSAASVVVHQSYAKTCPEIAASDYAAFRAKALEVVTREHDPLVLSK